MNTILNSIDLGDGMERAIKAFRSLRGIPALTLGVTLLLLCVPFGWLCWYFDLEPTAEWSSMAGEAVAPTLSTRYTWLAPLVGLGVTFLPILAQTGLSRIAAAGVRFASLVVFASLLFDVMTDNPRVVAAVDGLWERGFFDSMDVLAVPVYVLVRLGGLFMAVTGWEHLTVISLVCGILLLKNGMEDTIGARATPSRA